MTRIDRRGLLGACGALGASLAGCLDGVPGVSGSDAGDDVAAGTRWFPAPAALDRSGYLAITIDAATLYERREALSTALTEDFLDASSLPGFDGVADVESFHTVGNRASVNVGAVNREAAIGFYTDREFERLGEHEGYALLRGTIGIYVPRRVIAVGDDATVAVMPASSDDDRALRPVAEAVIDADAGAATRYHEAAADLRRVLEELPHEDTASGASLPPDRSSRGVVAAGVSSSIGASTTEIEGVTIFESAGAASDAVDDWGESSPAFQGTAVSRTAEGRIVRSAASVQTETVTALPTALPTV